MTNDHSEINFNDVKRILVGEAVQRPNGSRGILHWLELEVFDEHNGRAVITFFRDDEPIVVQIANKKEPNNET